MKNMIRIRNSVIIILCITVVLLGIGFIILSVELKKKNDEVYTHNVIFSSINKTSAVKGDTKDPVSKANIINNSEIMLDFVLNSPRDEITYVATIENKGTLPAEIIDIMESPNYNLNEFQNLISPVSVTISDVKGKIIPPGDKLDLKIVAYYNSSNNPPTTKSFSYKIGLITKSR